MNVADVKTTTNRLSVELSAEISQLLRYNKNTCHVWNHIHNITIQQDADNGYAIAR